VTINPLKSSYDLGPQASPVIITAIPDTSHFFVGWEKNQSLDPSIPNPCTITTIDSTVTTRAVITLRARLAPKLGAPVPPGLVSWWRAENNASDVMQGSAGNNGNAGPGITYSAGKVGLAFNFPGNDNIIFSNQPGSSLDVGAGNGFTLEAWINPTGQLVGDQLIVPRYPLFEWNDGSTGGTTAPWGVQLWISEQHYLDGQNPPWGGPGSLFANIVDTTRAPHIFSSSTSLVKPNVWQHVALTYDRPSGLSALFLNGTLVASTNLGSFTPLTLTTQSSHHGFDLYLGHRPPSSADPSNVFYSGLIDEPTIYNRALTLNEVFSIYSADLAGKDHLSPYFTTSSPLPGAALGDSYPPQQLTAIFGALPISFSLSAGSLPPGMALSSLSPTSGVVRGNPGIKGTFGFTVRATDSSTPSLFSEALYVLTVS
jgi:Concanavalin A-like lectin/glucanases superfamily